MNATGLRASSCTSPLRPQHPRHVHPLAEKKAGEAWRQAEGRGRCRCVQSSPRGATARRGYRRWFWLWIKARALPPGGANLCGRSCGAGGGGSYCVDNREWRPRVETILVDRDCGVGGCWGGCAGGRDWRSADSPGSGQSHGGGGRGRALEALAGEDGVGRERVHVAPGSVVFENQGNHGERARKCPLVSALLVATGLSVARGDTVSPSKRVRHWEFD